MPYGSVGRGRDLSLTDDIYINNDGMDYKKLSANAVQTTTTRNRGGTQPTQDDQSAWGSGAP
jgi:hypothetical protein